MVRNILFCGAGVILGFVIGFLIANAMGSGTAPRPTTMAGSAPNSPGSAPPLDPSQTDATLPPGHPDIGGAKGATGDNPNGAAATSAQAQSAMEAADRSPRNFELQMNAAATFYQLGAYDKAALYLQRALAIKPKDADALMAMGNTKYDAGDFVSAASFYEKALAERPNDVDVRTDLGNTYFRRSPPDYDRAIAEYQKSLAIDPKHEKTLQNIAAAALQKGDKETARQFIERLAAVNPSNPALDALRASL